MTLDFGICLLFIIFDVALLMAMAARRVYRSSPVFFVYVFFELLSGAVALSIYRCSGHSVWYSCFYLIGLAGDCLLYFWALAELGKNLLRSNGNLHPHWKLAIVLFAAAAVLTVTLSRWATVPSRSVLENICFLGLRVDTVVQFAGFFALISWSGLRRFHWPERELRIATGFGFAAFVCFLMSLLLFQWNKGPAYYGIYRTAQLLTLAVLAYWLHYFWVVDKGLPARSEVLQLETGRDPDDSETTQCLDNA